jgi:putative CocE/NonD family hydrolase
MATACAAPSRPNVATWSAPEAPPVESVAPRRDGATAESTVFDLTRAMVPMRDGARLQTAIFVPRVASEPLPILFNRTPYGIPDDESSLVGPHGPKALLADGYIFVDQSVRGRFESEGKFVMSGPPRDRRDPAAVDDSTDAYDTIEWLVHNVPNNNGRVGMWGGSYGAWAATMALLEPHPALRVVSEAGSPADQFLGDDSHHNGAFRLSYCFEFSVFLESLADRNVQFPFDRLDTYDWYLALGPVSNADARYFHGRLPSWNDLVKHPNDDAFWQNEAFASHLVDTAVPVLHIAGWWDQEDFYGPLKIYELLERSDRRGQNHLVVGPWNHGGWAESGRKLGDIDFGSDTGVEYRETIQAPWFARWLHDKAPPRKQPEARIFVTGQNRWEDFDRWPPVDRVTPTRLYLRAGRKLSFEPPPEQALSAFDEYVSDPQNPVPYARRPIRPTFQGSDWGIWEVLDQRFVDRRPDVMSWESDELDRDIVVAGDITADLFAATSGTDSDWIVKLIDVYQEKRDGVPDLSGFQLMIAGEVMRGRFRKSFVHPEPLRAGSFLEYKIGLNARAHAFLKGHRIMVQVQSTWFPLIDRNPQKYVDNIFFAKESDFVKATQRIGRSRGAPSAVILPILAR